MDLWELECLYLEEIEHRDIDEKWLEVWYSQFDYHPKGV